jgi:hypothetical protein
MVDTCLQQSLEHTSTNRRWFIAWRETVAHSVLKTLAFLSEWLLKTQQNPDAILNLIERAWRNPPSPPFEPLLRNRSDVLALNEAFRGQTAFGRSNADVPADFARGAG